MIMELTISRKEWESLQKDSATLAALEAGGVDNWEGYHESLKQGGLLEDE